MKALVVGGNGFVGMNVLRALVRAGHDAAGTRKPIANTIFARKLGAPLIKADLEDEASLVEAMRGRDVVFHCAAHYPRFSLDRAGEIATGRARARRVFSAARRAGVPRVVLTGTVATVGGPRAGNALSDERDPAEPRSLRCVYHAVKAAIEEEAFAANGRGLEVVVLNPTGIFGELDVKAGTGFLIVAMGNGLMPFFVEGKTNVIDADDLAIAHLAAAERGRPGERYIIGGHDLMVSELLERVADVLDVPFASRPVPTWMGAAAATFAELRQHGLKDGGRPFLARELVDVVRFGRWVDTSKSVRELGLPAPTPLHATLKKACDWYVRHRYVRRETTAPSTQTRRDDGSQMEGAAVRALT